MIYLTIIGCFALVLCGFILWIWQNDKKHCHQNNTEEAKRLYRFIDDMFDRIGADTLESYAFTQRIKKEILKQQMVQPEAKIEEAIEHGKVPPLFSQGKKR